MQLKFGNTKLFSRISVKSLISTLSGFFKDLVKPDSFLEYRSPDGLSPEHAQLGDPTLAYFVFFFAVKRAFVGSFVAVSSLLEKI